MIIMKACSSRQYRSWIAKATESFLISRPFGSKLWKNRTFFWNDMLFPQEMKWIKRWIFIKTKFWLLIRSAITFLYFLRSMVVIPVSAGFIKMISWSTISRMRSCNDVFCSTKNIKFFHEYGHVPNKGLQNRMSCHCTTLSSVAVRRYQQKNCQSIWAHNQRTTIMKKMSLQKFDFIVLSSRGTWAQVWQFTF